MYFIVLSTALGAPLAMLGLSNPAASERHCIFMLHPQITAEAFKGGEGQIIFPDHPTEYPCHYDKSRKGTVIEFKNQNDWRFAIRIGADDEGTWSATKAAETVGGRAVAPFGD